MEGWGKQPSLKLPYSSKLACKNSNLKDNGTFMLFPPFDLLFSPFLTCRDYWWGHLPIPCPLSNSGHYGKHPEKAEWTWPVISGPDCAQSPAWWIWCASSVYVVWTSGRYPDCSVPGCTSLCLHFSGCSLLQSLEYWSKYPWEMSEPRANKQSKLCNPPRADRKTVWPGLLDLLDQQTAGLFSVKSNCLVL